MRTVLCGLLMAAAALAADVTGKWTGSIETPNGDKREVVFTLKQDGDKLTGTTTGMRGDAVEISDGTVKDDTLSFNVKREFQGNSMVMKYTGKVTGDQMKVSVESPRGTREVTLQKAK